jgi:hypothetical protein
MENLIIIKIIQKLNYSNLDKDKCIVLRTSDLEFGDFNFFAQYNLYIKLMVEGYELIYETRNEIKVKKMVEKGIYFE